MVIKTSKSKGGCLGLVIKRPSGAACLPVGYISELEL